MSVFDQAQPQARKVFVSYSSIDRVRTNGLGLLLEGLGHQVFHDHRTIKPGMKWESALQEGLDEADSLMVFWTRHAARSDWVRKEYEYFYSTYPDRPLVPVLGDETPLPEILKTRQQADFVPIVNEVLDMKRKMKQQGVSASEIEKAVVQRLDDAGVEVKTKKQRKMLGLFLGFNWLYLLLRHPMESAQKVGRGAVEKTAQLSAGQFAAIGLAAIVGLAAGGPVADGISSGIRRMGTVGSTDSRSAEPPVELSSGLPATGETGDLPAGSEPGGGVPPWMPGMGDTLWSFRVGILESHDSINLRLDDIYQRLGQLSLAGPVSLEACQQESARLRGDLRRVETELAASRPTGEEIELPLPSSAEPVQEIFYVPIADAGEIVSPMPVDLPRPTYPEAARVRGIQGDVDVWATILPSGDVTVDSLSGEAVLAEAARRAVEDWIFRPGTRNGEAMARQFKVKIVFALTRG
ncbi:MAG TPA: TonB family protein [Gemmatimonadota bacterium]|nr:TonB family protein [Gemmatimonadota bacterium]